MCLPAGRDGACFAGCATDADCRDDYSCADFAGDGTRRFCAPGCTSDSECSGGRVCNPALGTCDVPFTAGDIGRECSRSDDVCNGGTCLTEFESGFPYSYCVYVGCDATAAPSASGCPTGSVCAPTEGGLGICLDACSGGSDCTRDGYDCLPSDRADVTSPTACMPACTSDTSCGNMGFQCNDGTGLCRMAFDPTSLGEPCASADDCVGGACIREADDGWPGGTCGYPGCRLSGSGPAETCPSGSVCVDDEDGSPEIGICLPACSTSASSCRPGYACVTEGSATDGHCGPACTTDVQCTGSRTCDTASGLCTR